MQESVLRERVEANPKDQATRFEYAKLLESAGKTEEALFHRMVARGLLCDHRWGNANELLIGKEAELEVRSNVFRLLLKPGAWIRVCSLCGVLRFDGAHECLS